MRYWLSPCPKISDVKTRMPAGHYVIPFRTSRGAQGVTAEPFCKMLVKWLPDHIPILIRTPHTLTRLFDNHHIAPAFLVSQTD
jgi:hypothetical protein